MVVTCAVGAGSRRGCFDWSLEAWTVRVGAAAGSCDEVRGAFGSSGLRKMRPVMTRKMRRKLFMGVRGWG